MRLTKVLCGMRLTSELESFWVMKYFMSASRQSCGICDEYPKVSCKQRYRYDLEKNATQMAAMSWQLTGSQKISLRSPNLLWK